DRPVRGRFLTIETSQVPPSGGRESADRPCISTSGEGSARRDRAALGICRVVNAQALATEMASVKGEAAAGTSPPCESGRDGGSGSDCAGRPAGRSGL